MPRLMRGGGNSVVFQTGRRSHAETLRGASDMPTGGVRRKWRAALVAFYARGQRRYRRNYQA